MSADTRESTDLDVLEALDFPIPCQVRMAELVMVAGLRIGRAKVEARCDAPAVAQVRCRGCGSTGFVCAEHRAFMLRLPVIHCAKCEARGPALVVYEFSGLGEAS